MASRTPLLERGFGLAELVVAMGILVAVMAITLSLFSPSRDTLAAESEAADLQQRLRTAAGALRQDIVGAGAGPASGHAPGPLLMAIAPILPYVFDAVTGIKPAREDELTLVSVPSTTAEAVVRTVIARDEGLVIVEVEPNCGAGAHDRVCGFVKDMHVVALGVDGAWALGTVIDLQGHTLVVQPSGSVDAWRESAVVTEVAIRSYGLRIDATGLSHLVRGDGFGSAFPFVDHVARLSFELMGEARPPRAVPASSGTPRSLPTTYGPAPPDASIDRVVGDEWGDGENCAFRMVDGQPEPRLDDRGSGELIPLTLDALRDGPWCPSAAAPNRFDADLLRVRRVRVTLRVEAADRALRGRAGPRFVNGGRATAATRQLPDQQVSFDVVPRNMQVSP